NRGKPASTNSTSPSSNTTNIPGWSPQTGGSRDVMLSEYEVHPSARWHSLSPSGNSVEATSLFSPPAGSRFDGLLEYLSTPGGNAGGPEDAVNGLCPRLDGRRLPKWSRLANYRPDSFSP
ncbi:hypothetical protein GGF41_005537, partial [Coemansia sp. RSA 2531]